MGGCSDKLVLVVMFVLLKCLRKLLHSRRGRRRIWELSAFATHYWCSSFLFYLHLARHIGDFGPGGSNVEKWRSRRRSKITDECGINQLSKQSKWANEKGTEIEINQKIFLQQIHIHAIVVIELPGVISEIFFNVARCMQEIMTRTWERVEKFFGEMKMNENCNEEEGERERQETVTCNFQFACH